MLEIAIPGYETIRAKHLLLDVNGTLTIDGVLIPGVAERIERLKSVLHVALLTSDTFGTACEIAGTLGVELEVLQSEHTREEKLQVVHRLGLSSVVAIGNGANDAMMVETAVLGIAVVQSEGASPHTLAKADVVFGSIGDALDALLNPQRLVASLRR